MPLIGIMAEKIRVRRIREAWMMLIVTASLGFVYPLYLQVKNISNEIIVIAAWGQKPPLAGIFEIDMLSIFMVVNIAVLGFLVSIYSIKYMEKEGRITEFYTLLLFMMAGMIGIVMAGDFFTLFIFWELMSISSYVLVAFLKRRWGPIEAGFKYLLMSATAGAFLLLSMALIYGMTGTLNLAMIADGIVAAKASPWFIILFSFLVVGFGVKSAIVPLHTWLPDAHPEAPSPISALLSGIVIETGLYSMCRIFFLIFPPSFFKLPISVLAILTMTVANIIALLQTDLKRLLAYSSISQIGYMLIGLASGTTYGMMGLFLHVFNHSIMKGMAFLSAGSIIHESNTREIDSLQGIGKMMPISAITLFIALLGLGGVPGTNGFISKFILFSSAIGAGMPWLAVAGVLNSALSMGYYLRVIKALFTSPEEGLKVHEAAPLMVIVTLFMAVLIVLFGLWPTPVLQFADQASKALVEGVNNYIGAVIG
jgi:proton-translocating NADH-quinone oxidoreductase chain N